MEMLTVLILKLKYKPLLLAEKTSYAKTPVCVDTRNQRRCDTSRRMAIVLVTFTCSSWVCHIFNYYSNKRKEASLIG